MSAKNTPKSSTKRAATHMHMAVNDENTPASRSANTSIKIVNSPHVQQLQATTVEDKARLSDLNKRLEKYIFAVRQKNTGESAERAWRTELEEENARIRETYDKELERLRKELEQAKAERSKLESDKRRLADDVKEVQKREEEGAKERAALERSIDKLHAEADQAAHRLTDMRTQLEEARERVKRAEKEAGAHGKEVDAAKAALAREEDRNVELASKLDNLKDELAFEKKVAGERLAAAEKERKELLKSKTGLEKALKEEFEGRLAKALAEADRAFAEEREKLRLTIEGEYKAKFADTLTAIDADARLMEELTAKNEELQQKLIQKQRELRDAEKDAKQLAAVNKQMEELQARLVSEQKHYNDMVKTRNTELQTLRAKLAHEAERYRVLLDQKIQLDKEIEYYSRLLDDEFDRMGLEGNKRSAPMDEAPQTATKRRRLEHASPDGTMPPPSMRKRMRRTPARAANQTAQKAEAEADGMVTIEDLDPQGEYVILRNSSTEAMGLRGWRLVGAGKDGAEVEYTFKAGASVPGLQTMTVYTNADVAKVAGPETHVVWKATPVWTQEGGTIKLSNNKDEVVSMATVSHAPASPKASVAGCRQQ